MAFSTKTSLFFFYTTLVLLLSAQIHARDSYFFGKFNRESPKDLNPNNVLPLEKATVEENGYGLYGDHETNYNNNNDYQEEFNNNNNRYNDKLNGETFSTPSLSEIEESYNNYDEKYPKKTESYNNEEFNNNKYFNDEFNNKKNYNDKLNGETFSKPSLSETEESYNNYEEKYPKKTESFKNEEFNNNKYYNDQFNNNNEEDNKRSFYNSNTYGTELERERPNKVERQGMSDTRFMEKGNYYYDLYNDRNHGHYYKKLHNKSPSGYYYNNNNNNNEEENGFKDPYDSKWEKDVMNEQPPEFVEEQVTNQFKP